MIITDTHTHLYSEAFDEDRDEMMQRALDAGVERFFIPAIDSTYTQSMLDLESDYPDHVFLMMGLHPTHVKENYKDELAHVEEWLDKKKFYEMKSIDQSKEVASRKVSEIISRFDRKIKDPRSFKENKKTVKIIKDFLKINCSLDKLDKTLNNFINKNQLSRSVFKDLSSLKNLSRLNSKIIFSTNFGRDIEYYSGVVFEIYNSSKKEIARGGRYDALLKSLGSKKNISAVGAAINLNNIKI